MAGRPTSYNPEYCAKVLELMSEGASIEEVCFELRIAKQTFYNWCEQHPEFLDAKKEGEHYSQGWWMKEGRVSLRDREFNYTGWYMNMKNRFKWADTQKVDHTSGGEKIRITLSEPNGD